MVKKPFLSEINFFLILQMEIGSFLPWKLVLFGRKINLFAFVYHFYWHYIITILIDTFSRIRKLTHYLRLAHREIIPLKRILNSSIHMKQSVN